MRVWHKDTIKHLLLIKIATVEACFKAKNNCIFSVIIFIAERNIKKKSNTKSCLRCNSDMVLRKATKGKNAGNEFWRCSSFPKCRNVVEIG